MLILILRLMDRENFVLRKLIPWSHRSSYDNYLIFFQYRSTIYKKEISVERNNLWKLKDMEKYLKFTGMRRLNNLNIQ
jgi:hypothetical protein